MRNILFHGVKLFVLLDEIHWLPVDFFGVPRVFRRCVRAVLAEDCLDCGLIRRGEGKFLAEKPVVFGAAEMGEHLAFYAPRLVVGNCAREVFYSPCEADFLHRAVMLAFAAFFGIELRIEREYGNPLRRILVRAHLPKASFRARAGSVEANHVMSGHLFLHGNIVARKSI